MDENPESPASPNSCEETTEEVENQMVWEGDEQLDLSDPERIKIIELCKTKPALRSNIGLTWFKALEEEFSKEYFDELGNFLNIEWGSYEVSPTAHHIYAWTNHGKIHDVKVVILGSEPLGTDFKSRGLAFGCRAGLKLPTSLRNIYKELATDIYGFRIPDHAWLDGWAEQGVLLLNTCLTVRCGSPGSHRGKGWEKFTDAVIRWIDANLSNVVFMLWGRNARAKAELINEQKHLILTAAHPCRLTANRGFFGCRHFSKANEYLMKHHKDPIDWNYVF